MQKPSVSALAGLCARVALASAWFGAAGCGGASPLLHPAHPLRPGQTAFAAGMSDRLMLGSERAALDNAKTHLPGSSQEDPRYRRGLLVALAEGPALAPFVSARIGIASGNEAGLSFSGQMLRADVRHVFEWGNSALSAGLGVNGHGFGRGALDLPGADLDPAGGVGLDLPLIFGYRSDADLLSGWVGARASFDHWSGKVSLDGVEALSLHANRLAAGPVLGVAIGLPPFWVAAELELDYARVTGTLDNEGGHAEDRVSGWSARPAGALIARF